MVDHDTRQSYDLMDDFSAVDPTTALSTQVPLFYLNGGEDEWQADPNEPHFDLEAGYHFPLEHYFSLVDIDYQEQIMDMYPVQNHWIIGLYYPAPSRKLGREFW